LTQDAGDVVVRDLASTNGTWINGRHVERGWLKPGDEMTIAHNRYRLEKAPEYEETATTFRDRRWPGIRENGVGNGDVRLEEPENSGPAA
jgi:hypothetical protein